MNKHKPEELDDLRKDLDDVINTHRGILTDEPRIMRPLTEARDAAKTKYDDVSERKRK